MDGGDSLVARSRHLQDGLPVGQADGPIRECTAVALEPGELAQLAGDAVVVSKRKEKSAPGLGPDEIKTLLDARDHEAAVDELRRIAERKLPELDAMIARAAVVRSWLEAAARCECPSLDECCLFEPEQSPPQPATGRSRFDR